MVSSSSADVPAFDWGRRYRDANTPWDCGGPHPEFVARLAAGERALSVPREPGASARAFVPGCGRGHDALALAKLGWEVTAVDLVPELADEVGPRLAPYRGRYLVSDALAFALSPKADLLFEHTFFSTLPPDRRREYGRMARRTLRVGGALVAIVFPIGRPADMDGPPFGYATEDLGRALGKSFKLRVDEPVQHPFERREWAERWAVFERI